MNGEELYMKNKKIIIGKNGSGKTYTALLYALKNNNTVVIGNYFEKLIQYISDFPKLSDYLEVDYNSSFPIRKNSKYYINGFKYSSRIEIVDFLNSIIFGCDYGTLKNDKDALIVYDGDLWNCQENHLLTLWKLSHVKCEIIIVVNSLSDLLHIPEKEITEQMKADIRKRWSIIRCV